MKKSDNWCLIIYIPSNSLSYVILRLSKFKLAMTNKPVIHTGAQPRRRNCLSVVPESLRGAVASARLS